MEKKELIEARNHFRKEYRALCDQLEKLDANPRKNKDVIEKLELEAGAIMEEVRAFNKRIEEM